MFSLSWWQCGHWKKSEMKCEQTISSELLIVPCLMLVYNIELCMDFLGRGRDCSHIQDSRWLKKHLESWTWTIVVTWHVSHISLHGILRKTWLKLYLPWFHTLQFCDNCKQQSHLVMLPWRATLH
jgi:hypothetical protein